MMPAQRRIPPDSPAYPVIAACLGEARRPNLGEMRRLIRRLRRECFPGADIDAALRRRISLAALAALGVAVHLALPE